MLATLATRLTPRELMLSRGGGAGTSVVDSSWPEAGGAGATRIGHNIAHSPGGRDQSVAAETAAKSKRQIVASTAAASMNASTYTSPTTTGWFKTESRRDWCDVSEAEDNKYMDDIVNNKLLGSISTSSSTTSCSTSSSSSPASSKAQARTRLHYDDYIDDILEFTAVQNEMVHQKRRVERAQEEVGGAGATKPLAQILHAAGGPDEPPKTSNANLPVDFNSPDTPTTASTTKFGNEDRDFELNYDLSVAHIKVMIENLGLGTEAFEEWHYQHASPLCASGYNNDKVINWWDEILEPGRKFEDFADSGGIQYFMLDTMLAASFIEAFVESDIELKAVIMAKDSETCGHGSLVAGRQMAWLTLNWLREKEANKAQAHHGDEHKQYLQPGSSPSKEGGRVAPLTDGQLPAAGSAGTSSGGSATAGDPEGREKAYLSLCTATSLQSMAPNCKPHEAEGAETISKVGQYIGYPPSHFSSARRRGRRHYRNRREPQERAPGNL